MKMSKAILEMLKRYHVEHVFGLPGETTLAWYSEWQSFPEITHVLARDERSASFMADGYARASFKPGLCEAPSVGSTHLVPGIAEAYKASVPIVAFTSDIPLHYEKRNMLTGLDQTSLFRGITKETITVTKGSEIANVIRRAFRVATTGRPGPVHVRIPMDMFEEEVEDTSIRAQEDFAKYPGHRTTAEVEKIQAAIKLLGRAERPVLICGQGVLYSQAWKEVTELAELFCLPVGTTINGKGSIAEVHPLSIGVIGTRGGTRFSNKVVEDADLIFYVGCNTDSVGTAMWTLPREGPNVKLIQLDISETEAGNNYSTDIVLIGDAQVTLKKMVEIASATLAKRKYEELPRIKQILKEFREYQEYIKGFERSLEKPVHPIRVVRELSKILLKDYTLVMDPGISAIYPAAFFKIQQAGRKTIFNYALGALGYAIPASIGAYFADPSKRVVTLTGDGSFGFCVGELETIRRTASNIKIVLFNNRSYGWIKAELNFSYGSEYVDFATNFGMETDYQKIAEGFGLDAYKVEGPKELRQIFREAFSTNEPALIEIQAKSENELVPPVPSWAKKAEKLGLGYAY